MVGTTWSDPAGGSPGRPGSRGSGGRAGGDHHARARGEVHAPSSARDRSGSALTDALRRATGSVAERPSIVSPAPRSPVTSRPANGGGAIHDGPSPISPMRPGSPRTHGRMASAERPTSGGPRSLPTQRLLMELSALWPSRPPSSLHRHRYREGRERKGASRGKEGGEAGGSGEVSPNFILAATVQPGRNRERR